MTHSPLVPGSWSHSLEGRWQRESTSLTTGYPVLVELWRMPLTSWATGFAVSWTLCLTLQRSQRIVLACTYLHNLIRLRYPQLHIRLLNQEDPNNHYIIPEAWRNDSVLQDMDNMRGGNHATRMAKTQILYLKHYFNSEVGAVPWQGNLIWLECVHWMCLSEKSCVFVIYVK